MIKRTTDFGRDLKKWLWDYVKFANKYGTHDFDEESYDHDEIMQSLKTITSTVKRLESAKKRMEKRRSK